MRDIKFTLLKYTAVMGIALVAGLALSGAAPAKTPGTIIFGLSSYPPGYLPWENKGTASDTVKVQLYRGLVSYSPEGKIRPEVAESWEVPNASTFVFKLRDNAYFHNGDPVTSADVKYTFEAITAKDSTASMRAQFGAIKSIEVIDDKNIKFNLNEPNVTFIQYLAHRSSNIVSAKSAADPKNPIGCGPYMISKVDRGSRIELEAFDKFYKPGLPKSKKLVFNAYKDQNLRVAALEAGDVDIIEYVPWESMDAIGANANLVLDVVDGPFMYLVFNTKKGPFTDARLRKAVAYGVKRSDVIAAAFFNRGRPLGGLPVPMGTEFHDAELEGHWKLDIAKAKALMAEAGKPNGFTATLLSTAQYGMHKNTAEVVQQNLTQIGINVKLNLPEWATRVALGNKGQFDFAVMGTTGNFNDFDALGRFLDDTPGASYARSPGFIDKEINDLMAAGRQELDPEKRKAIYRKVHLRALDLAPIVTLNWRAQGYATQKYVEGFKNMPGFLSFASGLTLENTAIK